MPASVVSVTGRTATMEVTVELHESMFASEDAIQSALNAAGCLATSATLQQFDTNGAPLVMGSVRWSSKGQRPTRYQTPYGEVDIDRHVYQTARGGATSCPLEPQARIIVTATPKLAQQVAHKLAQSRSPDVADDLASNHGRPLARSSVQKLAHAVGSVAHAHEEVWAYEPPPVEAPIAMGAIG